MRCKTILIMAVLILLSLAAAGCVSEATREIPKGETPISPFSSAREIELVLYFPHEKGEWLEIERRMVVRAGWPLEQLILDELLLGPQQQDLKSFLPPGVKAVGEIHSNTAYVSFSPEIRDIELEHEYLTVNSFVNSLTEIEGVGNVQILIDGKQDFMLAGTYIGEPLERNLTRVARTGYEPIPDCDPRKGEAFIEGEILSVSQEKRSLLIEVHLGPDTPDVHPEIVVDKEAIIHLQDEQFHESQINFSELEKGMIVGLILTKNHVARAIIVAAY